MAKMKAIEAAAHVLEREGVTMAEVAVWIGLAARLNGTGGKVQLGRIF